jgi:hypothetical protein
MPYDTLLDQLAPADLKLANIYLDPNNPRFTGSAWHYVPTIKSPSTPSKRQLG